MKKLIAISGSLRKGSYNTAVLRNVVSLAPQGMEIELIDIHEIPVFNQDDEKQLPHAVEVLKEKIEQADGIVFSSPEYNYAISGVLKNVLDWGSRPYGRNSWKKKIAGFIGATDGNFGTARADYDIVKILFGLGMYVVPTIIPIANVDKKLTPDGELSDDKTKEKIQTLLAQMADWIDRLG